LSGFLIDRRGCLLVKQSFFHSNPSNFMDLGGWRYGLSRISF
jgi:hypothetical protein